MKEKRLVMCTSTGCLEYAPERYQKMGIEIIHIMVNFEGKDYYEGYDLDPYHFFKTLETIDNPKENLPHSSIPEIMKIRDRFLDAKRRGYEEIIIIVISSYLGGTYNVIRQLSEALKDEIKITVIDAKITCFGEGLLAVEAQELVNKGVPTETIVKEIEWSKAHQEFLGVCGKLDYLIYNGRLKGGKAFMGKMLSICPVMHFTHEGVLEPFAQVMSLRKGCEKTCEELLKLIGERKSEDYILWHNFTGEHSADMLKEVEKKYSIVCNHEDIVASPVTGCHTGPYLAGYGLFFKRREDEPLS